MYVDEEAFTDNTMHVKDEWGLILLVSEGDENWWMILDPCRVRGQRSPRGSFAVV